MALGRRAHATLNSLADWPAHSLELFIRVVRQDGGHLSASKRKSHFGWMTDDELARFETMVTRAFDPPLDHDLTPRSAP